MINITDIKVHIYNGNTRFKGVAAITINKCFVIDELRIINGRSGMFVGMPVRKMPDGKYKNVVYSIDAETRLMIQEAILREYSRVADKNNILSDDKE